LWRWDSEFINDLRDGRDRLFTDEPHTSTRKKAQLLSPEQSILANIIAKLDKFRKRLHLYNGCVHVIMGGFDPAFDDCLVAV
jgi:hypothetical protein